MRIIIILFFLSPLVLWSQEHSVDLLDEKNFILDNAQISFEKLNGLEGLKAVSISQDTGRALIIVRDITLEDGVVELDLAGAPSPGAPGFSRGFVGLTFRTSENGKAYECFYLRATNARAEDQARRNHTAQYISVPGYEWSDLRQSYPGKYEAYVDMVPGQWTSVKIEFEGETARLFVHGNEQPTLIVNDLKKEERTGGIGLWVGPATDAYFKNLRIYKK